MSEPYSVMLRAQLDRDQVQGYLKAERQRASAYPDWPLCTGFLDVSGFRRDPPSWNRWLETTDQHGGKTYLDAYRRLRSAALAPPLFRFYFDDESSTLTQVSVLFSQGASELVEHLSVSRGISDFLRGSQGGLVVVHDPFLGNGTVGVIELQASVSRVVQPKRDHERAISEIVREFSGPNLDVLNLMGQGSAEEVRSGCRDELEELAGR